MDEIDGFRVIVPQSSGNARSIDQLQLCQAVKNLVLFAPPEQGEQVDHQHEERPFAHTFDVDELQPTALGRSEIRYGSVTGAAEGSGE